ncbi:MAG: hypothetical protein ABIS92_11950 [Polyangia bacterium]
MFVGHFAVALAAKKAKPRLSLPLLFAAVQFLDILWPVFILLGVEHARVTPGFAAASPLDLYDFPISHSLVTSLGWSLLFAAPFLIKRRLREGVVLAACVFSHFILDFASHTADMPLFPGGHAKFGLGLWNNLIATIVVEGALFVAGIVIYLRATRATGRAGTIGFAVLMIVLAAGWLGGAIAPPPPDIKAVAATILATIPVVLGAAWLIDRRRPPRTGPKDPVAA